MSEIKKIKDESKKEIVKKKVERKKEEPKLYIKSDNEKKLEKHFESLGIDENKREALLELGNMYDMKVSDNGDLIVPIKVKENFLKRMNKIIGEEFEVKEIKKQQTKQLSKKKQGNIFFRLLRRILKR